LLEEARALHSDAQLRPDGGQGALVAGRERQRIAVVAHGQHPDHLVAGQQRHAQEAARVGHHRLNRQAAPHALNSLAGQQQWRFAPDDRREFVITQRTRRLVQRAVFRHQGSQREADLPARTVVQCHIQPLGVGQAGQQRVNHRQQVFQRVRRRQPARHLVDHVQFFDRAPCLGLQARVFDGDGRLAGQRLGQTQRPRREAAHRIEQFDLDQADGDVVDHQGNEHPRRRCVAGHQLALAGRQVFLIGADDNKLALAQRSGAQGVGSQAVHVAGLLAQPAVRPGADLAVHGQRVVHVVPQIDCAGVCIQRAEHLHRHTAGYFVEVERDRRRLRRLKERL